MHSTFWLSIPAGYALGVAVAALVLPPGAVTALALPVAVTASMLAVAAAVAVTVDSGAEASRAEDVVAVSAAGRAPAAENAAEDRAPERPTLTPVSDDGPPGLSAAEVRRALDEGRVEVFVQPIVSLPQRRTVFYEGFTRIRDGSGGLVLPADYLPAAEETGLIARIDLTLLFGCARFARRGLGPDRRARVFCNVSPRSLGDPVFLAELTSFLGDAPDLAEQLVLELSHGGLDEAGWRTLAGLRRLGLGLSLDRPPDGARDAAELARRGVGFVKIGARRFEAAAGSSDLDPRLLGLHEALEAAGITPIVDRIETERTLLEVLDYPVRYGQGHLFGSPEPLAA